MGVGICVCVSALYDIVVKDVLYFNTRTYYRYQDEILSMPQIGFPTFTKSFFWVNFHSIADHNMAEITHNMKTHVSRNNMHNYNYEFAHISGMCTMSCNHYLRHQRLKKKHELDLSTNGCNIIS